ncbi:hypothetical protein BCV70DRAFT_198311 [Testicularia cyperi]|uniref:Uncharacterized protein n=1 Tax=Testicularia cyperi TaxID=1882483 RepID=A0A317XW33_9BASI|nr:hypothetical protein BCV70DRAFT_198311 [Testicularia cyperi]
MAWHGIELYGIPQMPCLHGGIISARRQKTRPPQKSAVLYCAVLYCAVLYCTVRQVLQSCTR